MPRTTRKTRKVLQHTAADTENLVGRPSTNLKHQLSQETPVEIEVKRKNVYKEQETQVNLQDPITAKYSISDSLMQKYWQRLAEKREFALQKSLEKIATLQNTIEELKQTLDHRSSLLEVIMEELTTSRTDDSGIDVNDVSTPKDTADDTADDTAAEAE